MLRSWVIFIFLGTSVHIQSFSWFENPIYIHGTNGIPISLFQYNLALVTGSFINGWRSIKVSISCTVINLNYFILQSINFSSRSVVKYPKNIHLQVHTSIINCNNLLPFLNGIRLSKSHQGRRLLFIRFIFISLSFGDLLFALLCYSSFSLHFLLHLP